MKIEYDPDIPTKARPTIKGVIKEANIRTCRCGCDELYVSLSGKGRLDIKCYDCGTSFLEIEFEEEE
jgi:phage FluMu protein Com